jgi:hypothetical protein
MLCVNCGKANADNFRFCQFCGTPMKADAHKSHSDLSPESLPESTVTSPISLDDWLIDSSIEDASLNSPAISESDFSLSDISMQASVSDVNQETMVPADMDSRDFSDGMPRPACVPASYARYEERICQKCGVAIADGHRFCGNCGSRFESKVALDIPVRLIPQSKRYDVFLGFPSANFGRNQAIRIRRSENVFHIVLNRICRCHRCVGKHRATKRRCRHSCCCKHKIDFLEFVFHH